MLGVGSLIADIAAAKIAAANDPGAPVAGFKRGVVSSGSVGASSASSVPAGVSSTGGGSSARSMLEMERYGDVKDVASTYGDDSLARQIEISREYNAAEADKAYMRQIEWLENYYPRLVNSMKAAGLNPILAANLGFSGSSAVQASSAAVGGDTYADLINAASNRRNSTSQRISALASVIGAGASVMRALGSVLSAVFPKGVH